MFPVLQVGKTYELLNCDKHKSILLKNGRDPGEVRPDITHQVTPGTVLTTLLSLCMEGLAAECCLSSALTMPWFLLCSEFADADG